MGRTEAIDGFYVVARELIPGCIYRLGFTGCSPLTYLGLNNGTLEFEQSGQLRYLSPDAISNRIADGKIWVKAAREIDNRRQQIATQY